VTLPEGLTPGVWTLDMSHSESGFTVRQAGISKVRGRFREAAAEARGGESLADATLHASVKAASFDAGDANRDAHVRGPDFFDVERYLEVTFRATWIRGDGEDYVNVEAAMVKQAQGLHKRRGRMEP
jgi:polyisoprenoid-binding protein YceI